VIAHLDMDCFYAAIEEREDPSLRGRPVAVGGRGRRGVLTTANYEARKHGCRSAMPTWKALELCPSLVVLPVRFDLYRAVSAGVRAILGRFSGRIEPVSLDEAYLDLSHWRTGGAAVVREIRAQIREETGLAASAGVAPNKLLAKIASDWNKPDGQFEVRPEEVAEFVRPLPVGRLWGVGHKMVERLAALGIATCGDLQRFDKLEMARRFGRWGVELWGQCRGIDEREVEGETVRKSLSTETTFREDVPALPALEALLGGMIEALREDLRVHAGRRIRTLVVKLKFSDFVRTTAERGCAGLDEGVFRELLAEAWGRGRGRAVRLLGVGVRFWDEEEVRQLELGL
jgi:DNA polymerase-4